MTNKQSDALARSVFLVIELVHDRSVAHGGVEAVLSRPGSSVVLRKAWRAPSGLLDTHQADDLVAFVQSQLVQSMLNWHGIQGRLGE